MTPTPYLSRQDTPPDDPSRRRWLVAGSAGLGAWGSLAALTGCASLGTAPADDTADPGPGSPNGSKDGPDAEPAVVEQVTPFSSVPQGAAWPLGWHPYVLRRDLPRTRYELVRDGGQTVLRARARRSATGLHVAVKPTPAGVLRFSWKVPRVATDASIDAAERDDCPARVIVAFDGDHRRLPLRDRLLFDQVELFTGQKLPYAMLMYVWGGAGNPVGSVHRNHRTARIQYLTVESGQGRTGQWLHYERRLADDHRRAFGEPPGPVIGVGVLTDADALKLDLEALYGDITHQPGSAAG